MASSKVADIATPMPQQNTVIPWEAFREESTGDARYDAFLGYEDDVPMYASVEWPRSDQDAVVMEEIGPNLCRVTDHTGQAWEFQIIRDPGNDKKFSGYGKHLGSGVTIPFAAVFIVVPAFLIIAALIIGAVVLVYCLWVYRPRTCLVMALEACTGPGKVGSLQLDGSVCRIRCKWRCKG